GRRARPAAGAGRHGAPRQGVRGSQGRSRPRHPRARAGAAAVSLSTPRWWYLRESPRGLRQALLIPLSWAWSAATARRIARAVPADVGAPVICVGNLTVGGAGKTPVARELLRRLTERGLKAHGLSRGHGGRLAGPARVDPERHLAADVGDEPLMLARDFPVWVA